VSGGLVKEAKLPYTGNSTRGAGAWVGRSWSGDTRTKKIYETLNNNPDRFLLPERTVVPGCRWSDLCHTGSERKLLLKMVSERVRPDNDAERSHAYRTFKEGNGDAESSRPGSVS